MHTTLFLCRSVVYCSIALLAIAIFAKATGADPMIAVGMTGTAARASWLILLAVMSGLLARSSSRLPREGIFSRLDASSMIGGTGAAALVVLTDLLRMRQALDAEAVRLVLAPHALVLAVLLAAIAGLLRGRVASPSPAANDADGYRVLMPAAGAAVLGGVVYLQMRTADRSVDTIRQMLVVWLVLALPLYHLARASVLGTSSVESPESRPARTVATVGLISVGVGIAWL